MPNPSPQEQKVSGASLALWLLTAINLLNYIDRYVPGAVKDLFKADLKLTDAQTSLPLSAFVIVYMLTSPLFGALEGRVSRKWLIAAGVLLWSLATGAAGLAQGFASFLLLRSLVGVGEAAYGTITPALLSDYYPPQRRNRVLTLFYIAIPVGAALGFVLGGTLGAKFGWRQAFFFCGVPGLLTAALVLLLRDPGRGTFDAADEEKRLVPPTWGESLGVLSKNGEYLVAVAGYTAVTFAAGAMADWFPTYLFRLRGMDLAEAGTLVGTATVGGGLLGTGLGGLLGDWLRGRTRKPYLALSAVSMVLATLCAVLALVVKGKTELFVTIFFVQFFMWFYNGPINATLVNVVGVRFRARAFALSILSIHILGDAISPPIVGKISDLTGNLPLGLCLVPLGLGVGALIWGVGWRTLPQAPDDVVK